MPSPTRNSSPPPTPFHPSRLSQCAGCELPASSSKCQLAIFLHMVIFMFPCSSLCSSHLYPPTLCPQVCSLYLHLCCCVNRFISTSFLSSGQFSRSVVSDSLQPHESQHTGFPVHHQLLEFTQTHIHQVGDAIQPSHPLSAPSPPAPNPSQLQGLFQ